MRELLIVAIGGAVGSVVRVLTTGLVYRLVSPVFPWGTLSVNLGGSLLFGALVGAGAVRGGLPADWRALLLPGLLGGFTTFSAFSFETVELVTQGFAGRALVNAIAQVGLGAVAMWAGLRIGSAL